MIWRSSSVFPMPKRRSGSCAGSRRVQPKNEISYKAQTFGPRCVQRIAGDNPPVVSEDCLTLNVWSSDVGAEKQPVMFYVHGGGFRSGSGEVPGEVLAKHGACCGVP